MSKKQKQARRLQRQAKRRKPQLLARDCWKMNGQWVGHCAICGGISIKAERMTVEHVIPKKNGGKSLIENLTLAHKVCNESAANHNRTWASAFNKDGRNALLFDMGLTERG